MLIIFGVIKRWHLLLIRIIGWISGIRNMRNMFLKLMGIGMPLRVLD